MNRAKGVLVNRMTNDIAQTMAAIDDDELTRDEYLKFARLFVLAKFALKIHQSNLCIAMALDEMEEVAEEATAEETATDKPETEESAV